MAVDEEEPGDQDGDWPVWKMSLCTRLQGHTTEEEIRRVSGSMLSREFVGGAMIDNQHPILILHGRRIGAVMITGEGTQPAIWV